MISGEKEFSFPKIENSKTLNLGYTDYDNDVIAMYLRFDVNYSMYIREVYSILEFLGDVGGLEQALFILGMFSVAMLSKRIFLSAIIKRVYQTNKNERFLKIENNDPDSTKQP